MVNEYEMLLLPPFYHNLGGIKQAGGGGRVRSIEIAVWGGQPLGRAVY